MIRAGDSLDQEIFHRRDLGYAAKHFMLWRLVPKLESGTVVWVGPSSLPWMGTE